MSCCNASRPRWRSLHGGSLPSTRVPYAAMAHAPSGIAGAVASASRSRRRSLVTSCADAEAQTELELRLNGSSPCRRAKRTPHAAPMAHPAHQSHGFGQSLRLVPMNTAEQRPAASHASARTVVPTIRTPKTLARSRAWWQAARRAAPARRARPFASR